MKRFLFALIAAVVLCGSASAQYLSPAKEGITLPSTYDRYLRHVLNSPRTSYYHFRQLHQYKEGVFPTTFLEEFNANRDFPWETTIGLNAAVKRKDNPYGTINLLHLPEGRQILVIPESPAKWIYPEGTVVGEIIYVTFEGKKYVQEIRLRTKAEGSMNWEPTVYRPLEDREEFLHWAGIYDYTPAKKHFYMRNPEEDEVRRLEGMVERLPSLPAEHVKRLLSLPFKDVTRKKWSKVSVAPSADIDFHIVPKDYSFGILHISTGQCMACHKQTSIKVSNLIPNEPLIRNNPDKVGRIRGSDGIFTWHPFDDNKVPKRQFRTGDDNFVVFNYSMCDEQGNVSVNQHKYLLTKEVEDALKGDELPSVLFRHKRPSGAELQSLIMQTQLDRLEALIKSQNAERLQPSAPSIGQQGKLNVILPSKVQPVSGRWIWDDQKKTYYRLLEDSELAAAREKGLRYEDSSMLWVDEVGNRWNYDPNDRYWWRVAGNQVVRR